MDHLKAVIVDDVRPIRMELKTLLGDFPNIKVVGEAANVNDAIPLIEKIKPDIVFLDIQLPGLSGFDLLEKIDAHFKLIFISSFKEYLPQAQKYFPVDFLLKPIDKKKLARAIHKIIKSTEVH
jgi:two-component system LytT family response regulator